MERDARQVRAEALATALSPQVGGPHGIQNAAWWKIVLSVALIVAAIMGVYHLIMPRTYSGRLAWDGQGPSRRLRLVDAGVLLDYNDASANVEIDGSTAMLPEGSLPGYFATSKVVVHWLPYWSKRHGASGDTAEIGVTN